MVIGAAVALMALFELWQDLKPANNEAKADCDGRWVARPYKVAASVGAASPASCKACLV